MLQFIYGRAGSGKTETILNKVSEAAKDEKCLLVVPEQFTVTAERAVLKHIDKKYLKNVEILNFRRLADKIFREKAFVVQGYLDNGGRYILMSKAYEAVSENLKTYRFSSFNGSFVEKLINVYDELKYYSISIYDLEEKARQISNKPRRDKLLDISLIIAAYDALLIEGFADSKNDLDILEVFILQNDFLREYNIYFDAFNSFTPQELKVVRAIILKSKSITFSLCLDEMSDKDGGYGLFSNVKSTAAKLLHIANKENITVLEPIILDKAYRFHSEDLAFLEKNIFLPSPNKLNEKAENVTVYSAKDAFDEASFIAAEISRLVRKEDYRYRDIALVGRNVEEYKGIIDQVFSNFDIPLFDDRRSELLAKPLILLVNSVFKITLYGFDTEELFTYLKTGLANIGDDEICLLENYAFMWGIHHQKWMNSFKNNPDGFGQDMNDNTKKLLEQLNHIRGKIIEPLVRFKENIKGTNGEAICREMYSLLLFLNIPQKFGEQAKEYKRRGELALSEEQEQVWDIFIKALDQLAMVLKNEKVETKRFLELFNLVISEFSIGKIPTSLDEVVIGNADRMRTNNPRAVFLLGLNDGVFPKMIKDDGLINDADRDEMAGLDLFLAPSTSDLAFEERFYAYNAMSLAREKVYFTYTKTGLDGKEARPSYLIGMVKRILPMCKLIDFSNNTSFDKIERAKPAFNLLASYMPQKSKSSEVLALGDYFKQKAEYKAIYENALQAANFAKSEKPLAKETIKDLYGNEFKLSSSRADTFYHCKFSYFCKYGLYAKPRRRAELASLEIGSFVHHILEEAISQLAKQNKKLYELTKDEMLQLSKEISKRYLENFLGGEDKTARFLYLFKRISTGVASLLWNLAKEFSQCGFVPFAFELPINDNGDVKPIEISLEDGGKLKVVGFADRVDCFEKEDNKYIRIVDYKTGTKTFSLNDVLNGLNLQMLIYLFSVWQNGEEFFKGKVMPAGILYYPASAPILKLPRHSSDEEIEKQKEKQFKMNGLLLRDDEILTAMESNLEGKYIPVKRTKEGFSSSSVATLFQFGRLKGHIEKLLKNMGEEISNGEIELNPFKDTVVNSCRYCDMKAICGYEPGRGKARGFKRLSNDDFWNTLEEGEIANG